MNDTWLGYFAALSEKMEAMLVQVPCETGAAVGVTDPGHTHEIAWTPELITAVALDRLADRHYKPAFMMEAGAVENYEAFKPGPAQYFPILSPDERLIEERDAAIRERDEARAERDRASHCARHAMQSWARAMGECDALRADIAALTAEKNALVDKLGWLPAPETEPEKPSPFRDFPRDMRRMGP